VRSVVGRFLEHSRIYYFLNGGIEEIYIGSADLMTRNLNHRVEVVFPIDKADHLRYLRDHVLEMYLRDNSRTRILEPDGQYNRMTTEKESEKVDVQEWLMNQPWKWKAKRRGS
jgi:polyphosphate kinase